MRKTLVNSIEALLTFVIFCLLIISTNSFTQTRSQKIDELMNKCYNNGQFNGSVLVSEKGKIIYNKAFGLANIQTKEQVLPITAFNLASVSKQFTAMAVMILRERGKLSYEDNVRKYLPELPYGNVTIRHLLNHTSGLPDYVKWFNQHWDSTKAPTERKIVTNADIVAMFTKYQPPILFKPGERWEYSNTGYALLFSIVEKASGESFGQFLKMHIFNPLQMARTLVYSRLTDQKFDHRAYGFRMSLDGSEFIANDLTYLDGIAGDGNIYSTTEDLFKWDQALYTEKLIKQATLQEAYTPARLNNDSTHAYGFGWSIDTAPGHLRVRHGGSWAGFRIFIDRDLVAHNAIILLTNNTSSSIYEIIGAIDNILQDRPYTLPKISIAHVLEKAIIQQGVAFAIQQYHDLKAKQPEAYNFSEEQLNRLGYQLLAMKMTKEAIAIFKLNIEAFPQSYNAYDSLGEAYMINGDKDLAIKNYEKSIELNPKNAGGIEALKKLKAN
ncbi:serine hydrolase [candidate division KSB1 bacterium]|nr:serine hydrolase [candidate division KSB1 bacterium]